MMPDGGIVEAERGRARYAALLEALQSLPVPVIAAVHGDALGGGLGLVAACDLAVADEGARLGTPEIKVGLFPYIITAVLQRIVSRRALLELMFTGDRIDAARAESLGLVNRVAPAGRSLEVALELADKVAGQSRAILALGKRSFYEAADLPLHSALELLTGRLTVNMLTEDAMEGVAAFLGRRPPEWKHR
jgi:enoyl-CoA hydratase/carnithine racemase